MRALAFALRGDYLDWDEALYLTIAQNILGGEGITLNGYPHTALGPFVPIAVAAASAATGVDPAFALKALSVLAGAALIPAAYYLLRIHGDERTAEIGGILLVAWPALIDVAPKLGPMWRHLYAGTEPIFLSLLFGALAVGELALSRKGAIRYVYAGAAGAMIGCAQLTRPEALVVAGLYVSIRFLPVFRAERGAELAKAFGASALIAALVVGPYLAHTRNVTGSWTPSGKLGPTRASGDLYQALVRSDRHMPAYLRVWWTLEPGHRYLLNPYWGSDPTLPAGPRLEGFASALSDAWPEEIGFWTRLGRRARAYLVAIWSLTGPVLLPLALLGLIAGSGGPRGRLQPFALATLAASLLTTAFVFALPRFFLYLIPGFALWASLGIAALADRAARAGWRVRAGALALVVVVIGAVLGLRGAAISDEAGELRQLATENRLASERLTEALPAGTPVMAWHPRLTYWGRFDWRPLPVTGFDDIFHYATARDIRYIFLARGMFSPLELTVPYVLFLVPPELGAAFHSDAGDEPHEHPAMTIGPIAPVAGFPTGSVVLSEVEADDDDAEP